MASSLSPEIEELHRLAVEQNSTIYHDPQTGFVVFTEIAHLKRGKCCGNQCRHCPYGWENVTATKRRSQDNHDDSSASRLPSRKVKSGDKAAIQQLLQQMTLASSSSGNGTSSTNNGSLQQHRLLSTTASSSSSSPESYADNSNAQKTVTGGRHGGRLTDKNVPYTRGGDQGTSQLLTGERRSKDDIAFEAMGTVDELCAVVGLAHSMLVAQNTSKSESGPSNSNESAINDSICLDNWLLEIMSRLFDIGSHVAKPKPVDKEFTTDGVGGGFDEHHIQELEDWIDLLTEALPELASFILPSGAVAAAQLHVARTVCRRAERCVIPLVVRDNQAPPVCDPNALKYLNRLSDFLFAAARYVNLQQGQEEVAYKRPTRGAKQRTRVHVSLQPQQGSNGTSK